MAMGKAGSGCRMRQFCGHCVALMGVVGEGAQGIWLGARGGEKKYLYCFDDRVTEFTPIFQCGMFDALFLCK